MFVIIFDSNKFFTDDSSPDGLECIKYSCHARFFVPAGFVVRHHVLFVGLLPHMVLRHHCLGCRDITAADVSALTFIFLLHFGFRLLSLGDLRFSRNIQW